MDSAYERMDAVIKALGYTSHEKFEDAVGLGHGFVSRITSKFTKKAVLAINSVYPQVNMNYVRTGAGEMFVEKQQIINDTPKERLQKYLAFKNVSRADFIKNTGIANNFPLLANGGTFSTKIIYKVNAKYSDLNMDWLATGFGKMLQEGFDLSKTSTYKERLDIFCDEMGISPLFFLTKCKFYEKSWKRLPDTPSKTLLNSIASTYPMLNLEWVKTGNGKMLNDEIVSLSFKNVCFVPLVPQMAYAGYLNGFADDVYISALPTIPIIKEDKEKYIAFEVSGDSMDDGSSRAYQDGDIVICKLIPNYMIKDNIVNLTGKEIVLVHKEGILIKQVSTIDMNEGYISLHSYNPIYKDLTLKLDEVMQVLSIEYQQKKKR